jgi:hypothetical protein
MPASSAAKAASGDECWTVGIAEASRGANSPGGGDARVVDDETICVLPVDAGATENVNSLLYCAATWRSSNDALRNIRAVPDIQQRLAYVLTRPV